jgi:rfaE bifunctional protein nucleotidyltransferase chain/domain
VAQSRFYCSPSSTEKNMTKLDSIQHKILPLVELIRLRYQWRMMGKKTVFTNGCFDVLHRGHTTYLLQAAELGNKLIIGLNTDASVKQLKGPSRPIFDEATRALNLAAHTFVDAVVLFDEDTPLHVIETLQPDVLVKGGDYDPLTLVGSDFVRAHGGRVITLPLVEGYSSTSAIERMKKA